MEHRKVGRYWNENAEVWTRLSRAGYDAYRDHLNTPAFLAILPEVSGLSGLDIGCGEGHNTRLLAQRGAHMTAIDIAQVFVRYANQTQAQELLNIHYLSASAVELPFSDGSFDFATGFMSFMDIPETARVVAEAFRILKPGGFLQFSIMHPCFDTPHRKKLTDEQGIAYAYEIGGYFQNVEGEISTCSFGAAPPELRAELPAFRVPRFTRTLSQWLNLLLGQGFVIEQVGEPRPHDEMVRQYPNLQDAQVVPYFFHIRVRKKPIGKR